MARRGFLSTLRYPEVCETMVRVYARAEYHGRLESCDSPVSTPPRQRFELNRGSDESWVDEQAAGTAGEDRHREIVSLLDAGAWVNPGRLSRCEDIA